MVDSHDISMVLITGAGASTAFGRDKQLPLMNEWSDALVKKLVGHPGYLEATGLAQGLTGPAFETQLGSFLLSAEAFERIQPILESTTMFQSVSLTPKAFDEWQQTTVFHLTEIRNKIHESLYEQFGPDATNTYAASKGYEALLSKLGVVGRNTLVLATTNYDTLAESALISLGRVADWGEGAQIQPGTGSLLDIDGLLDGPARTTPIIHLHGRVGWYRTAQEPDKVRSSNMAKHDKAYGAPVLVLPDPDKKYTDPFLSALWHEFENALTRARRVFVLGHSLNDPALVEALKRVTPAGRIMIGVYPRSETASQFDIIRSEEADRFRKLLPGAQVTPLRFGAEIDVREQEIIGWLTAELGN